MLRDRIGQILPEAIERLAKCRDWDSTHPGEENPFFFESRYQKEKKERKAKQICLTCPVREECLRHALEENIAYGVWGGISEEERKELRQKLPPTKPAEKPLTPEQEECERISRNEKARQRKAKQAV